MPNEDFVSRQWLIEEYRRRHQGPPGGALKMIEEAPAADVEPKRRWIPVTDADNLPKKSTPCLVACNQWGGEIVRKSTYLDSEKRFFEGEFDITEYVTHWMPSPEPPKGGQQCRRTNHLNSMWESEKFPVQSMPELSCGTGPSGKIGLT